MIIAQLVQQLKTNLENIIKFFVRNNPGNADKAAEEFIETSKMLKVT